MKSKNNFVKLAVIFVCLLSFVSTASAQKRRTTVRKAAAQPAVTTAANVGSTGEIKAAAEKVSIQLKNVSRFIYILGSVAQGIEDIDSQARTNRISKAALDKNAENKQAVTTTIRNLRAGLVALEIDFRAKPALRNYVAQIGGISDQAGTAEEQARAGRLTDSGKTLLTIIEKLSDTLTAMP